MIVLLSVLFVGDPIFAQVRTPETVTQRTGGSCSPAVVAGGGVTITCQGLDAEQRELLKRLPKLLDQLLRKGQADRDIVLTTLDRLLKGVDEIKRQTAPRTLSPEQRSVMASLLSQHKGLSVKLTCILGDVEGCGYTEELARVFKDAGWVVDGVNQGVFSGIPVGVLVVIKKPPGTLDGAAVPQSQVPEKAHVLSSALVKAGIRVRGGTDPSFEEGAVELRIGRRE